MTIAMIGRRMKRLCARPNYVHLNSLALGYLVGREQARLTGRAAGDDFDRLAGVMDFWAAAARSCRNDGALVPDEAYFTLPVLPASTVSELAGELPNKMPEARRRRVSMSEIARQAIAEHLGLNGAARRTLPFTALGRSGHRDTAERLEELLDREWTPARDR